MLDVASAAYLEYLLLCRRHIPDQRGPAYDQDCASTGASTLLIECSNEVGHTRR
jgi:hypothetical protein